MNGQADDSSAGVVCVSGATADWTGAPTTKPHAAKGREPLEPAALDGELNQSDTFPKMSFHAFSDLPTLKQSASVWNIHRKRIRTHIVVKDELSTELGYKHVAHWITRILNATLEFSNPLRRELRNIVNVLFGSNSTRNPCRWDTTFSLLLGARSRQFLLPLHLLTFTYSSQTPFPALTSRRPTFCVSGAPSVRLRPIVGPHVC
jgi:hypothetical protein